ncbi:hypothetical protein CYMTET_15616 [Cymbomonas tetramitiformis]|uniref:Uncharacterized protein n=1 Tax=Cymbomonas tetramitiformis TaxID=36881 RepID=A0AAE0GDY9_9CHLO|nr:hypothetical protein CYMTET_15616 [Cymbomonas tetramitiformis]
MVKATLGNQFRPVAASIGFSGVLLVVFIHVYLYFRFRDKPMSNEQVAPHIWGDLSVTEKTTSPHQSSSSEPSHTSNSGASTSYSSALDKSASLVFPHSGPSVDSITPVEIYAAQLDTNNEDVELAGSILRGLSSTETESPALMEAIKQQRELRGKAPALRADTPPEPIHNSWME